MPIEKLMMKITTKAELNSVGWIWADIDMKMSYIQPGTVPSKDAKAGA